MNFRHGIAAAALLSTAVFTVACAAPTAGTASAGSAPASTPVSTPSSTSTSPSTSTAPTPTTSVSSHAPTQDSSVADPSTVTLVVEPAGLDATTAIWLQNSCTDIGTLFGSLFAIPTVDENATLDEFRTAYRDYYATLTDTLLGMTARMSALDAPTIDGGQALHDGYLTYLTELAAITGNGAIAIDDAPDADTIASIVDQIQSQIDQLGQTDVGLADFQGAQLQDLMAQVPACRQLLTS